MLKPSSKAEIQFEKLREIGQNGKNSKSFLSRDLQLDAEIVIKQPEKAKLASPSDFFNESKALYASAHPNVVQILYACEDSDSIFLAMPYYKNGSIKDLLSTKHLTIREIIALGCNVLTGLHNIHSKKLIHFDIKPDNILISDRGEGLLSDFGLAKQMNFSGIAAQDRFYGPMIPPEATKSNNFDSTFDIYQFGLTLYRMCNGNDSFYRQLQKYGPKTSFDRASFKYDICNGLFPDRKAFAPHVPTKLRNIIRKCLQPAPDARFKAAIDCANELALVDGNSLDWRLLEAGDIRTWLKNESGTSYELSVQRGGKATCYKSVDGSRPRRVGAGCSDKMNDQQVAKFLGSY
jgi:serine/threonine protein kinase